MTLATIDPTSAVAVTSYLEKAKEWLATAVENTGPETIAKAKAEIATAAEAAKQLNLSREIQDDAIEMVRRAEYALGKSIKKGQAEGTVAKRSDNLPVGNGRSPISQVRHSATPVTEFVRGNGERSEVYAMADLPPHEFDEVLEEAKAEGNLSRANVARKAREISGKPRQAQRDDAEVLLNSVRSLADQAARAAEKLTPAQIARVTPKADLWTVGLGESVETLQRLLTSLNEEK